MPKPRKKRRTGKAQDSPLPPCGGARSGQARAEGGESQTQSRAPTPLPTLPHKGGGGASGELGESGTASASAPELVLVGEIGAAQGLKGEVRLRSYTQAPADIAAYGPLQDETGTREIEIERVRVTPKAIIARIKGVTTREAAEKLTRTKLYASRAKLRPAEKAKDGEWYVADLVGLAAVDAEGSGLGTITGVHNFGASDIVEIAPVSGGATFLVAFTETTVPEVDIANGRITVVLPEELEDEEEREDK